MVENRSVLLQEVGDSWRFVNRVEKGVGEQARAESRFVDAAASLGHCSPCDFHCLFVGHELLHIGPGIRANETGTSERDEKKKKKMELILIIINLLLMIMTKQTRLQVVT